MNYARISSLFFAFFCLYASTVVLAQEDTPSRREYREKIRALKDSAREYYWNLEKFEELLNAREIYQAENDSLRTAYQDLLNELARMQAIEDEARRLSLENDKLSNELKALNRNQVPQETVRPPEPKPKVLDQIPNQGTYFTVQVGAYTYNNYANISKKAGGETVIIEKTNGLNKYLIGLFEDYGDADRLKNKLLQIGMPEAWIVAYKDGRRVPMSAVRTTQSGG